MDTNEQTTVDTDETVDELSGVAEELQRISKEDEDGLLRPEAVVDAARDPESPLHDRFTWDDSEAAHQYRLVQARNLIARVTVIATERRPAYVNVQIRRGTERRRGYVPVQRAVAEPDLYGQVVADARRGIVAYRNRLSAFEQARAIVAQLDRAVATIDRTSSPEPDA